jgi:hypothetical protein
MKKIIIKLFAILFIGGLVTVNYIVLAENPYEDEIESGIDPNELHGYKKNTNSNCCYRSGYHDDRCKGQVCP